ncbi:hypothetical protein [Streptomyces sp. NPDC055085]
MEHCHICPQALSTEMWLDDEENLALYEAGLGLARRSGHGRLSPPTVGE